MLLGQAFQPCDNEEGDIDIDSDDESLRLDQIPESSAAISSTIMLKVPTYNLGHLRDDFEREAEGLNMEQFLHAFTKNMMLESDQELLRIVPDLVDFFNLVDVNGDGEMQWSEFVMFVIEQVVQSESKKIYESLKRVGKPYPIQSSNAHNTVKCCKFIAELNKIVMAVGSEIFFYDSEDKASLWLSDGVKYKLKNKEKLLEQKTRSTGGKKKEDDKVRMRVNSKLENLLEVVDMQYVGSIDVLCVLRSDMCIEFLKFSTRSDVSPDFILNVGIHDLECAYQKIAIRDVRNVPLLIFGVCSSNDFYCWNFIIEGKIGPVKLEGRKTLIKHEDFVRDILVMHNDVYSLIASGGLDKIVHIWDLESLVYRKFRSGHSAGIQCLGWDGRSVLFAGGFDYQIIGWDLDAEINKPLFVLRAHEDNILKIRALNDRLFSLDQSGVFHYWDINKLSGKSDGSARLIHSQSVKEDTLRCFDILPRSASVFPTLNGFILCAQGRNHHVYKIIDNSKKESVPVVALYSLPLLMIITVHDKDAIFWNATTGTQQSKLSEFLIDEEALCSCLDDRHRKLYIGSSSGVINEYNCLNGGFLKSFPSVKRAIRFLLYTPDKTLIAIGGMGDLFVFDDDKTEDTVADALMRECRASESEVTAIAYSHPLALIATADNTNTVVIWDYLYMTCELLFADFLPAGYDVEQLCFLDPYPLLLIADNMHGFTLLPVGRAAKEFGKKIWRVSPKAYNSDMSLIPRPPVLRGDMEESISTVRSDLEGETMTKSRRSKSRSRQGGATPALMRATSNLGIGNFDDNTSTSTGVMGSHEVEEEEMAVGPKPFSYSLMKKYALKMAETKCLCKLKLEPLDEEKILATSDAHVHITAVDDLTIPSLPPLSSSSLGKPSLSTLGEGGKEEDEDHSEIFIVTGHEDGTLCIFDLSRTLQHIQCKPLSEEEWASNQGGYDPRKICVMKMLRDGDAIRNTYSTSEIENGAIHVSCDLSIVWSAHRGPVRSVAIIGDSHDILSCGDDNVVCLSTFEGNSKGVLTRGKDADKLFKTRWVNPIDMHSRAIARRKMSKEIIAELQLRRHNSSLALAPPLDSAYAGSRMGGMSRGGEGDHSLGWEKSVMTLSVPTILKYTKETSVIATTPQVTNGGTTNLEEMSRISMGGASQQVGEGLFSPHNYNEELERPPAERELLIGQLRGEVTYEMSSKEIAQVNLLEKKRVENELKMEAIQRQKSKAKTLARTKKKSDNDSVESGGLSYLNELLSVDGNFAVQIVDRPRPYIPYDHKGDRVVKSTYDAEIERIDKRDPHNWDISSSNRQRAFYARMYAEMDKNITSGGDAMAKIVHQKLNMLSPSGDFQAFAALIQAERRVARKAIRDTASTFSQDTVGAMRIGSTLDNHDKGFKRKEEENAVHVVPPPLDFSSLATDQELIVPPVSAPEESKAFEDAHKDARRIRSQEKKPLHLPLHPPLHALHAPVQPQRPIFVVSSQIPISPLDLALGTLVPLVDPEQKTDTRLGISPATRFAYASKVDKELREMERNQTKDLWKAFEGSMKYSEKLYKRVQRQVRKKKLQEKKMKKDFLERFRVQEAIEQAQELGGGALSPTTSNGPNNEKILEVRPLQRHNSAIEALKRQTSIDGLLNVSQMKSEVEGHINAKLSYTLGIAEVGSDMGDKKKSSGKLLKKTSREGDTASKQQQKKGSLLSLFEGAIMETNGWGGGEVVVSEIKNNGTSLFVDTSPPPTANPGPSTLPPLSSSSYNLSSPTVQGFRSKAYVPSGEDQSRVNLQRLLDHPVIASRTQFTKVIKHLMALKNEENCNFASLMLTTPTASLSEIMHCLQPFMTGKEKVNSAVFLQEQIEKQQQNSLVTHKFTLEQIKLMKSLFNFFDKDKSGMINQNKLVEVLLCTEENARHNEVESYITSDFSSDLEHHSPQSVLSMNETTTEMISRLIISADEDRDSVLNFKEFVKIFDDGGAIPSISMSTIRTPKTPFHRSMSGVNGPGGASGGGLRESLRGSQSEASLRGEVNRIKP